MNGILTAGGAGDADYTKHWESAEEPLRATERGAGRARQTAKLCEKSKHRSISYHSNPPASGTILHFYI